MLSEWYLRFFIVLIDINPLGSSFEIKIEIQIVTDIKVT